MSEVWFWMLIVQGAMGAYGFAWFFVRLFRGQMSVREIREGRWWWFWP